MVVLEKISTSFVNISLVKDNIVLVDYIGEEPLNVDKGIQIVESIRKISNYQPVIVIHNVGDKYIFSSEALRFMGSQLNKEEHHYLARAIVTTNSAGRIAANNFIKFHKPLVPTKLFSEVDAALVWAVDFNTFRK